MTVSSSSGPSRTSWGGLARRLLAPKTAPCRPPGRRSPELRAAPAWLPTGGELDVQDQRRCPPAARASPHRPGPRTVASPSWRTGICSRCSTRARGSARCPCGLWLTQNSTLQLGVAPAVGDLVGSPPPRRQAPRPVLSHSSELEKAVPARSSRPTGCCGRCWPSPWSTYQRLSAPVRVPGVLAGHLGVGGTGPRARG